MGHPTIVPPKTYSGTVGCADRASNLIEGSERDQEAPVSTENQISPLAPKKYNYWVRLRKPEHRTDTLVSSKALTSIELSGKTLVSEVTTSAQLSPLSTERHTNGLLPLPNTKDTSLFCNQRMLVKGCEKVDLHCKTRNTVHSYLTLPRTQLCVAG